MNYKRILLITSPLLILNSCFPNGSTEGLAGPLASTIGHGAGIQATAKLDRNLKGPITNKQIMEETASKIKRGFPLNQSVQDNGRSSYNKANSTLDSLKSSIKSDIRNGSKTSSTSTKNYADQYAADVASLKQVYADASGRQDKAIGLLGALGLLEGGFNIWSTYSESKKQVLLKNVDNRLASKSWGDIQ